MYSFNLRNLTAVVVICSTLVVATPTSGALADPEPPQGHKWGWGIGADHRGGHGGTGGGDTSSSPTGGGEGGGGGSTSPVGTGPNCPGTGSCAVPGFACGPWSAAAGCPGPGGGAPPPQITPIDLLQRELAELRLPLPEVLTAPPRGKDGRVGLPEWFWLDPAQTKPITRRAQAGPVWVELTAAPQQMNISPGPDIASVTCPGVGAAYPAVTASSSACTYTYVRSSATQSSSAYTVTATVVWGGTWRGSGGVGGALTPISVSDSFPLRIGEAQGLTTGGR